MILVTGGTGLVGSYLLLELVKSEDKVRAIKRKGSSLRNVEKIFSYYTNDARAYFKKIEWYEAELENPGSLDPAFQGITKVYHCAAMVSFNPKDKNKMLKTNIEGTGNVVNLCLAHEIDKLCFVSSIAALGEADPGTPVDEKAYWKNSKGRSHYAISKMKSEMEVWRGITEGLNAVIVNPSVILGAGNWKNGSPSIISVVANGLNFYTTGSTGFVDVRDVATAMVLLMESDITNERFILNSENLAYKEIFDMISSHLHVEPPKFKAGRILSGLAWRLAWIWSKISFGDPVLTRETVEAGRSNKLYDNSKFKERFNFEFRRIHDTVSHVSALFLSDKK